MAKSKSAKQAPAPSPVATADRAQLDAIRADYAALSRDDAARLLAQHDDATCHARGTGTRAEATFRGALDWGLTLHTHRARLDAVISPPRVRWFLDCLTALGEAIDGAVETGDPARRAALRDAEVAARQLSAEAARRITNAAGTNSTWRSPVDALITDESGTVPSLARLQRFSKYIRSALKDAKGPPLALFGADGAFADALDAAAKRLADATAAKPAQAQPDRDTSPINVAEGRLYFVMRAIWDDLAAARTAQKTDVLLPVSDTLLRGLGLNTKSRRKKGG